MGILKNGIELIPIPINLPIPIQKLPVRSPNRVKKVSINTDDLYESSDTVSIVVDTFVNNEEIHFTVRGYYGGGTENPMVRADMIYYKTPNDGALFAPGSLSFCGSLSYNNYNNNVSKILENAIRGFLKEGPLP